jgi:hypothetical protein
VLRHEVEILRHRHVVTFLNPKDVSLTDLFAFRASLERSKVRISL